MIRVVETCQLADVSITNAVRVTHVSSTITPCTTFKPHVHRSDRWLRLPDSCAVGTAVTTPFLQAEWDLVNGENGGHIFFYNLSIESTYL